MDIVVSSACSNRSRIIPKVISKPLGVRPKNIITEICRN